MSDFNTSLIDDLRAHGGHATSGPFVGRQVLILTTTGAKIRRAPRDPARLLHRRRRIVIVASKGGAPQHPAWYHNIVANPSVTIEVDGERYDATATVVDEARAPAPVRRARRDLPGLRRVRGQDRATVIPVIVLQRKVAAPAAA